MATEASIVVRDLRKSYGEFEAVRGLSFEVQQGEVFGLLGPNGAGKTSTIEILESLRTRTSGEVRVLGLDPGSQGRQVKDRIGVSLQATNLPDKVTVMEALDLFGALYSRRVPVRGLLDRFQLWDKRNSFYTTLSGGQKQRLALALALLNDPQLVFFDEPTAGLDPQVRLEIHSLIQQLRQEGRTVLLTTHYIEEAERLCDRVAIVDEGRIIAIGSPREIQQRTMGHSVIDLRFAAPPQHIPEAQRIQAERVSASEDGLGLTVSCLRPARTLIELLRALEQQGIEPIDLQLKRPTLEDVFLEMTGKRLRE